jgi:hypothetical protein
MSGKTSMRLVVGGHARRWKMLLPIAMLAVPLMGGDAGGFDEKRERWPDIRPPIMSAATWAGVAPDVLAAVVWVESRGHPWAIRTGGMSRYPQTHAEAVALVRSVRGRADIGLAQIHYPIWGPALGLRPEDLLDPWVNLHAAARILRLAMAREPGSWGGVGRYHSGTPRPKWAYASRVAHVVRALRATAPPPGVGRAP